MSIQALQTEIERKAEEEVSRILETARQEAQRIVAEANTKAASLREERARVLQRELDAREKAELAVTRMDVRGKLLRVQSEWANRVFEEAEKRIGEMAEKGGREYQELLSNLILAGISAMNGNKFIVETNARDKEVVSNLLGTLAEKAGKNKGERVILQMGTLQTRTLGGVIVSTEDRVQSFNNILEARLSAASRKLEGTIRRILSGGDKAGE
ncbi:MAG: V-type ATP synthase subunit E family protein [Candidatus Bathyarchaeia archaeon]